MGNEARRRAWSCQGSQAERLLLLALAEYIPDGRHTCWPAIETLAGSVGVGPRQTQRLIRGLEESGAIVTAIGRGRKHTTTYGLLTGLSDEDRKAVIQDVKGDIVMSPLDERKGDIPGQKGDIKHDIAMSPIPEEKVTSGAQKVTFPHIKGDIAMSPEPKRNEKRTERVHTQGGRAPPKQTGMDQFHEACQIAQEKIGKKLTPAAASSIARCVTDIPKWEGVVIRWAERYGTLNVEGLLDWYEHPEKMERQHGPRGNQTQGGSVVRNGYRPPNAYFPSGPVSAAQAELERSYRESEDSDV